MLQRHHIIHREVGGLDIPINFAYIEEEEHKEIHKNKELDTAYKNLLLVRLNLALTKAFYTEKELITLLEMTKSKARKILKFKKLYKEGYSKQDIINIIMRS